MSQAPQSHDEGPIQTPKQLIVAILAAFVVPVAIIVLLVLDPLTTLPSAAWVIGSYAIFAGVVLLGLGFKLRRA